MPSAREALTMFLITAGCTAVIFRIELIRGLVTGIQTPPYDPKSPNAQRALYV